MPTSKCREETLLPSLATRFHPDEQNVEQWMMAAANPVLPINVSASAKPNRLPVELFEEAHYGVAGCSLQYAWVGLATCVPRHYYAFDFISGTIQYRNIKSIN